MFGDRAKSPKVLVTGANGFIGRILVSRFRAQGYEVVAATRKAKNPENVSIGEINSLTNWQEVLSGIDCVVHLAALAHVPEGLLRNSRERLWSINVAGALKLANQAASVGVRRFIFLSSAKVLGEFTGNGFCFNSETVPRPVSLYAVAKYEAEQGLYEICRASGMELVIVRPPLVYGPDVRGNFGRLLKLIDSGIPLPLASVSQNRRSYISVGNLVDFLSLSLHHPAAAQQTFLVSDDDDVSTLELITRISRVMNKPARLFSVPSGLLRLAAKLLGRGDEINRLLDSLWLDISYTKRYLQWHPPTSLDDGLKQCFLRTDRE